LITKNEENNIEYCLSHLKSIVNEQIVVDTGSTDRTVEIAESLGAKVFHFEWIEDFSAARNFALDKAKGDWVIFLDCDEYFNDSSIALIRNYIKNINENRNVNGVLTELINIDKENNITSTMKNISPRIFRNKKTIRYKNKIHEYLVDLEREKHNFNVVFIDMSNDLKVLHTGYDSKVLKEKDKNARNINMLKKELDEKPEDSQLNLYMSKSLFMNQQYKESLDYALQALKCMDHNKNLEYYPTIYSSILYIMYALDTSYNDMKIMFDEAVSKYPRYPDYYRAIGIAAIESKQSKEAIRYLEECIYYCKNYNSNIESTAIGQIEKVYSELLSAYIMDENKPKIVEISVALLNTNKYEYENVTVLIKTLLTQENEEDIISFLSKIYDYNNFKDKIYLIKASEAAKSEMLINYYRSILKENELKILNSMDIN
jgi:glycosyltransferase involved in cell wall biosynthesis